MVVAIALKEILKLSDLETLKPGEFHDLYDRHH